MKTTVHRVGLWFVLVFLFALAGCEPLQAQVIEGDTPNTEVLHAKLTPITPSDIGGGEVVLIHLPLPSGTWSLCTQGAKGGFSHGAPSTCYDIDLDTSNALTEELYAPVSGVARVHYALLTGSPFGNHINIDLGNGYYVVIAHLYQTNVCDGCEVAVGQLIAFEGCTGACTGDHVHIGLHKGDASLPAEHGESVPATYLVASADGEPTTMGSEKFVCGVGGEDDVAGESYGSVLPVARAHPEGTLVITSLNPKVYLIDQGQARWITDEQVFWSHGYDFADVVLISDEELGCYGQGEMIYEMGFVDAVTDPSGVMWLLVGAQNTWNRYRVQVDPFGWQGVLASWGLSFTIANPPAQVGFDHPYMSEWSVKQGSARFRKGALVKEASSSAVYVAAPEVMLPIKNWQTYLMLGFFERPIITVEDGTVLAVQKTVGSCVTGTNCLDVETVSVCGNGVSQSSEGGQGGRMGEEAEATEEKAFEPPPDPESQSESEPEAPFTPGLNANLFCPVGEHACLSDLDMNGVAESLLMADHLWLSTMLNGQDAYVYGYGGCFNGGFTQSDVITSTGEYYVIDFSHFAFDCASEFTLVATIGNDGQPPSADMANWLWWQNAAFCLQGSTLCNLMNNGKPWEEWLIAVSWHPISGLSAIGNGLTSNSQL